MNRSTIYLTTISKTLYLYCLLSMGGIWTNVFVHILMYLSACSYPYDHYYWLQDSKYSYNSLRTTLCSLNVSLNAHITGLWIPESVRCKLVKILKYLCQTERKSSSISRTISNKVCFLARKLYRYTWLEITNLYTRRCKIHLSIVSLIDSYNTWSFTTTSFVQKVDTMIQNFIKRERRWSSFCTNEIFIVKLQVTHRWSLFVYSSL
jgi:hypothetical protein